MVMDFTEKKEAILKKAQKLSLLCHAEVSIIIISRDNELVFEYTSPTSTMKKIIDQYQSRVGIDIWSSHYEKMQEELRRLEDVNTKIRRNIMLRKGEELDNLNMENLCSLEEEMLYNLKMIQNQKKLTQYFLNQFRVIGNQIDARKKKVRWLEELQQHLQNDLEMKDWYDGSVVNDRGNEITAFYNPALVQQRDDNETSCLTTAAMDVEDSA